MPSTIADLKAACAAPRRSTEAEMIKQGVSTWFCGLPAPAPEGTVALAIGGDAKVIINEGDIRSVEKVGERYRVEVSAESNFLLRIDKVLKATASDECGCDKGANPHSDNSGVARREKPIVWEICRRICGIVVVGGLHFYVCVDIDCITLDPGTSKPK